MNRRLIHWIWPPCLITVFTALLAFTLFTAESATSYFYELSSFELSQTARIVANTLPHPIKDERDIATIRQRFSDMVRGTDIRLTLIDSHGLVLADTMADPEKMENHLMREEVQEALEYGKGSASRRSGTTDIETAYEAVRLDRDETERPLIMRAALPSRIIAGRRAALISRLVLFALAALAFVAIAALLVARGIAAPIRRIHEGALAFSDGALDRVIREEGPLEVASLAQVLNRMASDLSSRMRSVDRQKDRVEAILNGMAEAVALVDRRLMVIKTNPAFRRLFASKGSGSLAAITRSSELCDFMETAIHTDGPLETSISLYEEKKRELHVSSSPLVDGNTVLVLNDLTRLRRLETIRRDFTSNVSHELRTPITAIKAAIESLASSADDQESRATFIAMAQRNTERLEAIIDDLTSLARIEEDEDRGLVSSRVELGPLVERIVEELKNKADAHRVAVQITGETGLVIAAHEGLAGQALANLLDNAIKYGGDGGSIEIHCEKEARFARLSVKDRGPGIPEKDRERIFERFYRVDKARSRDSGGTGLGLSIVKHIALALQGSIELETRDGGGSSFILRIPLAL